MDRKPADRFQSCTIEVVNPADYIDSIRELLQANWDETGFDFEFDPDVDAYRRLYELGFLYALAAFVDEKIVGYCTIAVTNHAHNKAVRVASNDALFVLPEYRHGIVSGKLIATAVKTAKQRGASRFTWHCRAGTKFADVLIKHGYQPVDIVVMKVI